MSQDNLQIIVQAGGRGSRLRHHTWNKPKCLVSVNGKTLLYHLFDRFPQAEFVVIGDYGFDQLENYLEIQPPLAKVRLVKADGHGTLAGIAQALSLIEPKQPLMMVWSDLLIGVLPPLPYGNKPVVGITSAFTCRWTVSEQGRLQEVAGHDRGVPGLFYFPKASLLPSPPLSGEFVAWFSQIVKDFDLLNCDDLQELGDFSTIEANNDREGFSRYFNQVSFDGDKVVKTVRDPAFQQLHQQEIAWYRQAAALGFRRIPQVYGEEPFTMARIEGQHIYQANDLTPREKRAVMADYLEALMDLHSRGTQVSDPSSIHKVYSEKTQSRVREVAKLIPGLDRPSLTINGRKCRNLFHPQHQQQLWAEILPFLAVRQFVPIHGDPTFSNSLIDDKLRVWFFDPRGSFAQPGIYGDRWYDFAKVYYSAIGGYDLFNRRKFKLYLDQETVEILLEEPVMALTARPIFQEFFGAELPRIEILHGLIWLSLTGYVKDDIDSIIASFYLGLYWLEQGLSQA